MKCVLQLLTCSVYCARLHFYILALTAGTIKLETPVCEWLGHFSDIQVQVLRRSQLMQMQMLQQLKKTRFFRIKFSNIFQPLRAVTLLPLFITSYISTSVSAEGFFLRSDAYCSGYGQLWHASSTIINFDGAVMASMLVCVTTSAMSSMNNQFKVWNFWLQCLTMWHFLLFMFVIRFFGSRDKSVK